MDALRCHLFASLGVDLTTHSYSLPSPLNLEPSFVNFFSSEFVIKKEEFFLTHPALTFMKERNNMKPSPSAFQQSVALGHL